ncbi:stringent starvation protein B [Mesocricetibacter intestinalis]|uniref:Stringent starvation protein B n=1 Tax=Mesocricetibacter intestinalis TaxID=1521930 RepID=A0A4R6V822_9PAST|nr:ClpXP protease specificity-enhancing factor [Mesocricetibacter intestinalis]TDQ57375.1 stringent starvation protein B [Mesocricetibacter intestinalis]
MEYHALPKRPYLLRAYYDWLIDSNFTPYLVVDATYYGVNVPAEYVKDGQIVLNLAPGAVGNFHLSNEGIQFNARFQGIARDIYIPMGAALAIYARENGDGVMFEPESCYDQAEASGEEQPLGFENITNKKTSASKPTAAKGTTEAKSASHLRIIK